MGRRSRRRQQEPAPEAPTTDYADPEGNVLTLRGVLTPATRREYDAVLAGSPLSREDAWHRAAEFLFERLAVRWTLAGLPPLERQQELLGRYRLASAAERDWIRATLRTHVTEHFPGVEAP